MSTHSLWTKLSSVALSSIIATGALGAIAPSADAANSNQQYLATEGVPTVSATKDQINLPFAPNLYYSYGLLSEAGKKVWDWTLKDLLLFDPEKDYHDSAVSFQTQQNGDGVLTFDLQKKKITAKPEDIKSLNHLYVLNEPRMFILRDRNTAYTTDDNGNVKTVSFTIASNWMGKGQFQKLLADMEVSISDILSPIDPRQNDAQRINAFYDNYMAKEHYVNAGTPGSMPGAFISGNLVCGGYAKGFEYLAMRAGVEAVYLLGQAGGYHAWNTVKLDDNKWYVVDSTWDDHYGTHGAGYRSWFLKGTQSTKEHSMYTDTYSVMPTLSTTNYAYTAWLAPEDILPQSKKAVDQLITAVKNNFNNSSLTAGMTKVTVSIPQKSTSSATIQDGILQNNLNKDVQALKLKGTATITVSKQNNLNDILSKGLTIEYKAPGTTESYKYTNGQFIQESDNKVFSDADVAAKVLDLGKQVATLALKNHQANVSNISGLTVNLPGKDALTYTPKNDTEKKIIQQITSNLQNKFNGELSVMVLGNYSSINEVINKGLVIGYKAPDGTYYTLMGGKVITTPQQQK